MTKLLRRYLCTVAIVISLSACGQNRYVPNPDEQVVRELSGARIVMLADYGHELPAPYRNLIATISAWLTMVQQGTSIEKNVTLFLEEDINTVGLVREYIRTGNLNPLLDAVLPSTSMERFEFYADLRGLTGRIDSVNQTMPESGKIVFDIQGSETTNVFDEKFVKASRKEGILYFVHERDSLAAANILGYLEAHPMQKGLVFYGGAHLIKNWATKNVGNELPVFQSQGYYLAFYLKRTLGEQKVLSVNQVVLPSGKFDATDLDGLKNESGFVRSENIPWKEFQPGNYDAFIFRKEVFCPDHPFDQIFSRRILAACIGRMKSLAPSLPGHFAERFYNQAQQSLRFITGKDSMDANRWNAWYSSAKYNGMTRLHSKDFREQLTGLYKKNVGTPQGPRNLERLGFLRNIAWNSQPIPSDEWESILAESMPRIIFLNALGMYWIGDKEEKREALKYLVEFSGHTYEEPDLYLKWWRKRFYNVSY